MVESCCGYCPASRGRADNPFVRLGLAIVRINVNRIRLHCQQCLQQLLCVVGNDDHVDLVQTNTVFDCEDDIGPLLPGPQKDQFGGFQ